MTDDDQDDHGDEFDDPDVSDEYPIPPPDPTP